MKKIKITEIMLIVFVILITLSLSGESVRSYILKENDEVLFNSPSLVYKIPTLMYDNSHIYLSYDGEKDFYEGNIIWSISDIMFGVGINIDKDSLKIEYLRKSYNTLNVIPFINFEIGKYYSAGAVALSYNLYSYLYNEGEDYISQSNITSVSLSADRDMDNAYFVGWGTLTWGKSESSTEETTGEYNPSYLIGALYKSYELSDEVGFYFKGVYKKDQWRVLSGGEETLVERDSLSVGGGIIYSNYEEDIVLLYINYDKSTITHSFAPVEGVEEINEYKYEYKPVIGLYSDIGVFRHVKLIGSTKIDLLHTVSDEEEKSKIEVDGNIGMGFEWNSSEIDFLLNKELIFNTIFSYDASSREAGDYPILKVDVKYSF